MFGSCFFVNVYENYGLGQGGVLALTRGLSILHIGFGRAYYGLLISYFFIALGGDATRDCYAFLISVFGRFVIIGGGLGRAVLVASVRRRCATIIASVFGPTHGSSLLSSVFFSWLATNSYTMFVDFCRCYGCPFASVLPIDLFV